MDVGLDGEPALVSSLSDRIELLIVTRNFKPGDRMPAERSLAADFGVSRSSLREAIHQLASRGRLVSRHGGGTFVASPEEIEPVRTALLPLAPLAQSEVGYWQDVMEIRKSLEGDTAYFAALRATDEDKARLTSAYHAVANAPEHDPAAQARADAAFHLIIAQAAHNAVLHQVMAGLLGLLEVSISVSLRQLYHLPGVVELLDQQHRQILDSIIAGRANAARQATVEHLDFVERRLRLIEDDSARQRRSSRALRHVAQKKDALP